jgi:hypothetical protein
MIVRISLLSLVMMLGLGTLGGCEAPLFPEALPRTQYERSDRLRGTYAPKDAPGPYGDAQPALRERLMPYE